MVNIMNDKTPDDFVVMNGGVWTSYIGSTDISQPSIVDLIEEWNRRKAPGEKCDISIRAHTSYSVHRYTSNGRRGSAEVIADGATLQQADTLAKALAAAHPEATVQSLTRHETRYGPGFIEAATDPYITKLHQSLMQKPPGASVTYTLDGQSLLVTRLTPETIQTPQNHDLGAVSVGDIQEMENALRALPYPLAAAMRRNAYQVKDQALLNLLDRCQVATDVIDPSIPREKLNSVDFLERLKFLHSWVGQQPPETDVEAADVSWVEVLDRVFLGSFSYNVGETRVSFKGIDLAPWNNHIPALRTFLRKVIQTGTQDEAVVPLSKGRVIPTS